MKKHPQRGFDPFARLDLFDIHHFSQNPEQFTWYCS